MECQAQQRWKCELTMTDETKKFRIMSIWIEQLAISNGTR